MKPRVNTWLLLPLGLAVLTYVRALGGDFVWDDEIYLKRSSLYASSLREILFPPMLSGDVPYYRPTANLGGLVLFRLSGGQIPWLWHAATVLLHAVTTTGSPEPRR